MSNLRDIVQFRSDSLGPVLSEECQVNPQVYGAELAYWLCPELGRMGIHTSYPVGEDWGWLIEYTPESGSEFAIHCGNVEGRRDAWLLSLRRHARKLFGRDKPPYEEAARLVEGIQTLLSRTPHASEIQWLYDRSDAV